MSVASASGHWQTSIRPIGRQSPAGKSDGIVASGEFADLIASRQSLASASQVIAGGAEQDGAAPSAGEFAATAFFRNVDAWENQASDYAAQAMNLGGDDLQFRPTAGTDGFAADPLAHQESALDGDVSVNPFATADGGRTTVVGSAARLLVGQALAEHAAVMATTAGPSIAAGQAPPVRNTIATGNTAERAGGARRGQMREPARPATISVNLASDGEEAAVSSRVAGLSPDETKQLDRRIRDELASARLGVREIRLNGRRSRANAKE